MLKVAIPDEMREIEKITIQKYGIPGMVLMENAAIRVVERILEQYTDIKQKGAVVICGTGNNGGDGLAIARHLYQREIPIQVVIIGWRKDIREDALNNLTILEKIYDNIQYANDIEGWERCVPFICRSEILIDAIFGTGLNRNVTGIAAVAIQWMAESHLPVVAVDMPSGIDGSNGKIQGAAVRANHTITFSYPKVGQLLYPGRDYAGVLHIEEISIPHNLSDTIIREVLEKKDLARMITPRSRNTHKGDYGKVCIIAGSKDLTGAGAMTAQAAARTGSGLVTLGVPASLSPIYQSKLTEVMVFPLTDIEGSLTCDSMNDIHHLLKEKDVLAIGPGLGKRFALHEIFRNIMSRYDIPIVIDADGLNHICQDINKFKNMNKRIIVTPHPGEMARLTGLSTAQIVDDPINIAQKYAVEWNVVIVLKGSTTIIAAPSGEVTFNLTGNPGMATGGSGDVLTGIIVGLLAQGFTLYDAARVGCYIHGAAGDACAKVNGEYGMLAGDLIQYLPIVLKEFAGR